MITVGKAYGGEYPPREYMGVGIMADVEIMDTVELEGPEQEGNILGEIIFKIVSFIKKIIALIMPVSAVV